MKSEHRHELSRNSAEELLKSASQFWKKYKSRVVLVALAVALVFLGLAYHRRKTRSDRMRVINKYKTACRNADEAQIADPASLIEDFKEVIELDEMPRITVEAMNRVAGLYLDEFNRARSSKRRDYVLDRAKTYYDQAIARTVGKDEFNYLAAAARIGLARIAENRADFQKAKEEYRRVIENGRLEGSPQWSDARRALDRLEETAERLSLPSTRPAWIAEREKEEAEKEQPASAPASAPATGPADSDTAAPGGEKTPPAKTGDTGTSPPKETKKDAGDEADASNAEP